MIKEKLIRERFDGMEIPMASVVGKKVESMSMILMWPLMWRTECISVSL